MYERNKLNILLLAATLAFGMSFSLAQEEGQSQQQYTMDEYNEYQKAAKEGPASLLGFIDKYPDSVLTQKYAAPQYIQMVSELYQKGQYSEAASAGENFLQQVDANHYGALYLTGLSFHMAQSWDKAAQYAEQAYEMKPADSLNLIPMLARAYQNSGNIEKSVYYAEEYCPTAEPAQCWDLLPMLRNHYASQKEWQQAGEYAQSTLEAFESNGKPEGVSDDYWNNYVKDEKSLSHGILGRAAFERENFQAAERNYKAVLSIGAENKNLKAEAYYFIGRSQWSREQIDPAMEAFAKCFNIKGTPYVDTCHKQLETLYKGTHNGSLAGFEEFLDRHRSE